jgi:hypothetical protein
VTQTPDDADGGEAFDWFGLPSPAMVRAAGGLLAAAAVALLGALVLGEYEFEGWLPVGAGALFGLVVAEVAGSVGRRHTVGYGVVVAVVAGAGLVGAGLISAGPAEVPGGVWVATAVGAVVALVWVAGLRGRRR